MFTKVKKKLWYLIKTIKIFFKTTKSLGIQLKFLTTFKMSIGIQKSVDFDRFFISRDFLAKIHIKHSFNIPTRTLEAFHDVPRLFFLLRRTENNWCFFLLEHMDGNRHAYLWI
jgi:hypothetical protein